jgi:hypothetical protein
LKAFRGRQEPTVSQIAASAAVTISADFCGLELLMFGRMRISHRLLLLETRSRFAHE